MVDDKKVLFKKPKKRKLTPKRTRTDNDDEEVNNNNNRIPISTNETEQQTTNENIESEEEDSTLGKIQALKKARKIKSLLKISTLERSRMKPKADAGNETEDTATIQGNQDLRQKLEGTFEVRTGNAVENENNVMTLKHQMAMQEYIDAQMKQGDLQNDSTKAEQADEESTDIVKDKKDLYAKILREATLMGSEMSGENQVDEDMGAGGEMLGGTGIAEVELPVEQRLQTAKETALAASRLGMDAAFSSDISNARDSDRYTQQELAKMFPTSFVSGKNKAHSSKSNGILMGDYSITPKTQISSHTEPKVHVPLNKDIAFPDAQLNLEGIGSSYSHNFRLHNKEWILKKKEEKHLESNQQTLAEEDGADSSRIGFDAKRGKESGTHGHGDNQRSNQRSRDHATYKNFVSREMKNIKR
jgi:hypothetical protein